MRITQWGEYGIHCLTYIAEKQNNGAKSVSAQEIADAQNIDILYAQQILQKLRKSGLIQSLRGPQGGYLIAKSPKDISLQEVLKATEGDTFEVICEHKPIKHDRCIPGATCNLRPVWHQLKDHIDVFLKKISVESLMQKQAVNNQAEADKPLQITPRQP